MGGLTPSEIFAVARAGAEAVKVFPASSMGGPVHLKALKEVFPEIALVPTGGVNLENLADYVRAGAAFVGVGGDLIKPDAPDFVHRARAYLTTYRQVQAALVKKGATHGGR
jgi:2-dehydro-3-deoxyphosphogluconate aldolase/(4S)-4-hydroxy-2-oxoglutarate aldolase